MINRNPWLEIESLEVWDNKNKIFNNLTLNLYKGQNTIILGPNGAGKSAIVGLINRTIYPVYKNSSNFKLFGSKEIDIWNIRSKIGLISTEIDQRISGKDRVRTIVSSGLYQSFSLQNKNKTNKLEEKLVSDLLDKFSLQSLSNKEYRYLSDGQKRRVLLARSMINKPEVLVLDEPTSKLDIKSKIILFKCLRKLMINGTTLLLITHDLNSITKDYSRIVFLKAGEIIRDGSQSELLNSRNLSELFEIKLKLEKHKNCFCLGESL